MRSLDKVEIYVVLDDGTEQYYLLKVVRRGLDVYCVPPHLGLHYSLHESGEAHFRYETSGLSEDIEAPPVIIQDGEAGVPIENGIIRASLGGLGRASGICTAIYPIDSINDDFKKFSRTSRQRFLIDSNQLPEGTSWIEVGVWAVPKENKVSFDFNNPGVPSNLLHKSSEAEPQIWIFARQFL